MNRLALALVGIAAIVMTGCPSQSCGPVEVKAQPSCAWYIANYDVTSIPSSCQSVAFEFGRMYINEHPELKK